MTQYTKNSKSIRHFMINNGNKLTSIFLLFLLFSCNPDEGQSNDILLACGVNGDYNSETQQCDCTTGWEGELCDQLIADCTINPCESGECDEATGMCICDEWHWGVFCEKELVTFEKYLTEAVNQFGKTVFQTSDNGYLISGKHGDSFNGKDLLVMKTDALGNEQWKLIFTGYSVSTAYIGAAIETSDGYYIISGNITPEDYWKKYAFLAKIDTDGQLVWTHTYEEANNIQYINDLVESPDGGYLLVGNSYPHIDYGEESDVYLLKTTNDGQKEWSTTIGLNQYDEANSIVNTNDGGYAIAGRSYGASNITGTVFLLKINENGMSDWHRVYGFNCENGASVHLTADGGFIILGETYLLGNGSSDLYLMKTDNLGTEQWFSTYGTVGMERGYSIDQADDGGFILCGTTKTTANAARENIYLLKTDESGTKMWSKIFGGFNSDIGSDVMQNSDGGFTVVGTANYQSDEPTSIYLIKTNRIGEL